MSDSEKLKVLTGKVKELIAAWDKFTPAMVIIIEELKFLVKDATTR